MKPKSLMFLGSFFALVFCFNAPSVDEIDKELIIKKVRQALTYLHFSPKKIDNAFSEEVYNRYLDDLDPNKRTFVQADINQFSKFKDSIDDFFLDEDLTFYNISSKIYRQRLEENHKMELEVLNEPMDFNKEDYLILDDDLRTYPKNEAEKKEVVRKYMKYLILDQVQALKEDDKYKDASKEDLISEAVSKVKDNIDASYRRLNSKNKDRSFDIYMNAIAEDYDPHTYYFSPKDKEFFDQSISGTFEGIGATLQDQKGYATIMDLIVGGPAWKSKKINKDDKIIEVAEKGKEPVNIVGMPLDDAIRLIRGKKGTDVTLTLKKVDGSIQKVTLERDVIEIEESFVRSTVLKDAKGRMHGYVYVPSFYIPVTGKDGRNVSDDLKKEIEELKKQNIQSVIIDLRNNGGGSLSEVVEIMGLFIKKGPVVQVKSSNGDQKVYFDTDGGITWEGPLVVMTNEFSASASEILAGAVQDYNRGIIVGSKQTYGKGTVQTVMPLDRFSNTNQNLGDLKLTIQKFYRITGSSTQLKGVESDIILPDKFEYSEINEGSDKSALPWDEINGLDFEKWDTSYNLEKLKVKSKARLQGNKTMSNIQQEANWMKTLKDQKQISLKYDEFMKEVEQREAQIKSFDKNEEFKANFTTEYPKYELKLIEKDTVLKSKREDWHKNITKDFYIQETVDVLNDAL